MHQIEIYHHHGMNTTYGATEIQFQVGVMTMLTISNRRVAVILWKSPVIGLIYLTHRPD